MVGDHNEEEIDKQSASGDDYDSGVDGSEYSSGESNPEDDMINEDDWELLRVSTRQNHDKQTSFCEPDLICY